MIRKHCVKACMALAVLFLLTSCAMYGHEFECERGKGQGCKSISKINKMVDKGEITDDE